VQQLTKLTGTDNTGDTLMEIKIQSLVMDLIHNIDVVEQLMNSKVILHSLIAPVLFHHAAFICARPFMLHLSMAPLPFRPVKFVCALPFFLLFEMESLDH
jgi:hypothetical protein